MKSISSLSLLLALASCGFNTSPQDLKKLDLVNSDLISIREVNEEVSTFMVRLEAPSLIESASHNGADIKIDEGQKALVLSQQQQFVESIKKIDPTIQVLYSTKLVMNSVTVIAHPSIMKAVNQLPMVKNVREMALFNSPSPVSLNSSQEALNKTIEDLTQKNSVSFIGAKAARESLGLTGKGLRIGILDTGIDYTHTMFGGSGSVDEYKKIDATKEVSVFPNNKIIGGIDLVGDLYSPSSPYKEHRIPKPDMNPLDYNGHGTHVAGTVAGLGDGVNTYDGVAPDSTMYAIKVFGQNSTGDAVVIAGLEYALDPNGDLNPDDRMDIVNLSLGGPYGKPSINYAEAVKNVVKAGVSFVAAAGNSGSTPYIVGAPSTAVEAFSVAAGIDDMLHTTQVDASKLTLDGAEENIIAVFGSFSKKLIEGEVVSSEIVYVGLANEELSADLAAAVKGKIALIDRGGEPFATKSTHAFKAGAIGVALANNRDEEPSSMSGDIKPLSIPVVMISQANGLRIKEALKSQKPVTLSFSSEFKFSRPEFIDTITGFSSRGPRSEDGMIKPEIVAPGQLITSAHAGGGAKAERLNGTSMASPHMAGVMALIKQRFPSLTVLDHKHILMTTAKIIHNEKGVRYPVTSQGAGRVDVIKAVNATILPSKGSFSLGKVDLTKSQVKEEKITLTNLTSEEIQFSLKADLTAGLTLSESSQSFSIKAGAKLDLNLNFNVNLTDKGRSNYDGFIKLVDNSGKIIATFPVLAVIHQSSEVIPTDVTQSESKLSVMLKNNSTMKGSVLPFNLIDTDVRKPDLGNLANIRSRACDIKSAGYRFVSRTEKIKEKEIEKEVTTVYLQLGVKLYESVSSWEACGVSVLIDSNNDGNADQEWVAAQAENLPGMNKTYPDGFYSYLLDAHKARALRDQYEIYNRLSLGGTRKDEMRDTSEIKNEEGKIEDYRKALLSLNTYKPFNMSSVSVMEIELGALAKTELGTMKFKMAAIDTNESSTQQDDYLAGKDKWHSINVSESEVKMMPEEISLEANESKKVELVKSESSKGLVLFSPTNSDGKRDESKDMQENILK